MEVKVGDVANINEVVGGFFCDFIVIYVNKIYLFAFLFIFKISQNK